jgi:hypothetical protein
MNGFKLLAEPWWVNFLMIIPLAFYFLWKKKGLRISGQTLVAAACLGIAFGFVEATAVVYLRAATGLLPESPDIYRQIQLLETMPKFLMNIEFLREAATMIMLAAVAFLAVKSWRERWAVFLWTFAIWDIFYYVWLWAAVRWPSSLATPDVLFLIPVPWFSQVWFPLLVSILTMVAVFISRKSVKNNS